jgi:hypothetical protein
MRNMEDAFSIAQRVTFCEAFLVVQMDSDNNGEEIPSNLLRDAALLNLTVTVSSFWVDIKE